MQELCKQYKLLGKSEGEWWEREQGPICLRCSPGSAQGFRLWASEWVIALVSQIWKFATSASQIKIEMSFATTAKKKKQFYIS